MDRPLAGVKMVEVAQFTFTPAAGAVLADWGADVIKVEHAETGDAQRGMRSQPWEGTWMPIMEHPNRGKRSIGLALENPDAREVLLDLCRDADVFLTNFLPDARRRLAHRRRRHPRGEPADHLRPRQRARPARPVGRARRLRRLVVLVPDGQRVGRDAGRPATTS